MTFTSVGFAVFLACVAFLYYVLPARWQNSLLLAASAVFYAFGLPGTGAWWQRLLPIGILAGTTAFTFYMARAIGAAQGARRKRLTRLAIVVCVAVLALFKYYNYAVPTLLGLSEGSFAKLALPLGISFYTFAVISYLVDVSRGDMPAAESFIGYAAFVSFFATITSGPICRAQKLLPQLAAPRRFEAPRTVDALRLMLFGFFKQIAIANVLGLYVNVVFEQFRTYSGLTLIFAAVCYALQLYYEFAGYSDIARGAALLLGLEIPVNFKTPYFSTNFSAFWGRWHISLSSWLQDYVFMPLVWGRWTSRIPVLGKHVQNPPMVSSVALVFLLSGFWHGNTWPFVLWGCLQAAYRVGEELLHRWKKPAKKPKLALRTAKTAGVFVLWAASLVFFRIGLLPGGTVSDCFAYVGGMARGFSLSAFAAETSAAIQAGFYTKPVMVLVYLAFVVLVLGVGLFTDWVQCFRLKDKHIALRVATLRPLARWAVYYALIGCILAAFIMQSGGFGTVSFAYANF